MRWKERSQAAGIHLLASLAVASFAAVLVYMVWYPYPYREVAGGNGLFRLIVAVDVVLGPLLTFVVFNRAKPRAELWRDLAVVAMLQLAALGYGLWTVFQARPVYLVHEVDRFRVVTAAEIDPAELPQAKPEFQRLPLHGIRVIGVRKARDSDEMLRSIESALAGKDVSAMPGRWQELDGDNQVQIRAQARDLASLRSRAKGTGAALEELIATAGVAPEEVIALPLVGRSYDWAVVMDRRDLRIIGYLPIDLF